MSEFTMEDIEEALRSFNPQITGWEYDENATPRANMVCIISTLIDTVKSRDEKSASDTDRIQRLHLKLGQLAEKL